MRQIERDLLAERPLDTLLRKLILLGGNSGSAELRDWASAELRGYAGDDVLPTYRKINAPLQIDGVVPGGVIRHQTISAWELPDFVQGDLDEIVPLRMGVREIQSMVTQNSGNRIVKLQPPGAALVSTYMNREGGVNGQITALYWSVSTIALEGVLDQVRTRLAELIAELRSGAAPGQQFPTPTQAANAVNFVINGRGNRVHIAQASDGSTVNTTSPDGSPGFWTRARVIGAAVVGLATIAGTAIAAFQFMF